MKLSLIVPAFNEEENIENFQNAVIEAFKDCSYSYEIIFINDGSVDGTFEKMKKLFYEKKCSIKVINLSRNFGKESAIYAGLNEASGEYITIIDADLQQRPEIVLDMVSILEQNKDYDVVAAYQDRRGEGRILSFLKKIFYKTINFLSDVNFKADASDFRTFRRSVSNSIIELEEFHRFSKGIFSWVGYNTYFIPYTACDRVAGKSNWSFFKLVGYAIEGIIGYSRKPLRIATLMGMLTGIAAILYSIVVILQKIVVGIDVPGYATLIIIILFLGAIQLFCIGIIGEYVGRTFEQSKNRPVYIIKEILDDNK